MKWEYKTIKLPLDGFLQKSIEPNHFNQALNREGRNGWELVSTIGSAVGFGETKEVAAIFKRPVG